MARDVKVRGSNCMSCWSLVSYLLRKLKHDLTELVTQVQNSKGFEEALKTELKAFIIIVYEYMM